MKKNKLKGIISAVLILSLATTSLVACGSSNNNNSSSSQNILDSVISVKTKLTNAKLDGEKADSKGTVLSTMVSFTPAPACNGNPAVNGGPDWSMQPLIYDYLCDYSSQPEKTFKPSLLESYDFTGNVLTLKLRDDIKWSDGSQITSDDLLCTLFLEMTMNKIATHAEKVTKVDDLTVEIKYINDAELLLSYILKTSMKYPASDYGKFSSVLQEACENGRELDENGLYKFTKDADLKVSEATADFNNYLPDLMSIKCSGPYVPKSMTSAEIIFEQNPYYRIPLYIEKIKGIRPTSTESTALAVSNGDYDAEGTGLSPDMAQKVAEKNADTIRQMVVPEFSSLGFEMNTKNYPTDDVNVRKAIAYIIDTEQIAPVSEPGMVKGDEYAVGLPPSIRDKYLSKDFLSTLNNYDSNYEKAEECLKAAGWSKKGEKWVDAKGESPEIVIAGVGEYPAYVVMGEAAANMLNEFGLNASYTSKEAAAYNDYCTSGQGNMTVDGFASATATQHPYEAYYGLWWYGQRGMNLDFPTSGDVVFKDEVTGEDFNFSNELDSLFNASSDEEVTKLTEKFAKLFNDNVWFIPVTEKYYVYRIHNPKLSMAEAETGKQLSNFYWSGTTNEILAKTLRDGKLYYVK